jgi:hypothetical protein
MGFKALRAGLRLSPLCAVLGVGASSLGLSGCFDGSNAPAPPAFNDDAGAFDAQANLEAGAPGLDAGTVTAEFSMTGQRRDAASSGRGGRRDAPDRGLSSLDGLLGGARKPERLALGVLDRRAARR